MSVDIRVGDALTELQKMESESVQCCVTSPPYWGLRDYGVKGQLGLERTPEVYVDRMMAVFREVRRVLRDDGTLWLNLGDCYAGSMVNGWHQPKDLQATSPGSIGMKGKGPPVPKELKHKDLVGIPWRIAFALQADGWYLRCDVIWHKENGMPESVIDRPTQSHEYLFLLAKRHKYYYDSAAIKERCESNKSDVKKMRERKNRLGGRTLSDESAEHKANKNTNIGQKRAVGNGEMRNKRSVWKVATVPHKGAHFATFPPALIRPCILAGCPIGGTVLDPFAGSGTTGMVAEEEGRNSILIELNPEYAEMARERTAQLGVFCKEQP